MKKLTINISPKDWGHLVTKYSKESKQLLPADFTDGTINIDTDVKGVITKSKGTTNYNPTLLPFTPKDQFEAIFSDGARHLLVVGNGEFRYSSGDGAFNTVVNGSGFSTSGNFEFATTQDRVYCGNAINQPQVYDRQTNYGGVAYTAPQVKVMGAQVPGSGPTSGTPTAGGSVPDGQHTYKVTFLYYELEESNGSTASAVQTCGAGNNTIPLTNIPTGGYGVTSRKIYRDNNDGVYTHIWTLADNTTTTFNDTLAVGVTPTPIPTDNGLPPLFGQIVSWLDRMWCAQVPGDPSTLFYSESGLPDIFGDENELLCNQEDPITTLVVYFDRLIVFNRRSMGQILGKTKDTFRYSIIPSSVGCVDNRTLQIRVIEGVPILIWLSERGFYSYDGNSINYISDPIENLVNFNIQQALQQKNSNTQTSQSHFQAGTASPGIDLISSPGSITTDNPQNLWNDQSDWEGGDSLDNIATKDTSNTLQVPIRLAPALADGSYSNITDGADPLVLTVTTDFTGESNFTPGRLGTLEHVNSNGTATISKWAQPITPPRAGTLGSTTIRIYAQLFTANFKLKVWRDSLGNPGTEAYASSTITITYPPGGYSNITFTPGITVAAEERIWIGIELLNPVPDPAYGSVGNENTPIGSGIVKQYSSTLGWENNQNPIYKYINMTYSFTALPLADSGHWLSPIHDSKSDSISTILNIAHTGSYPTYTSTITTVEGSDDSLFLSGAEVSESFNNLNGNQNLTISGKRYWRIRIQLDTTDNRVTPTVNTPILKFNTTGTWISDAIDCTADVTAYNALDIVQTLPSGTSVTLTVRTATTQGGLSGASWVSLGSATVRQWFQVRAVCITNTLNSLTPSITSIHFKYTITANLVSSAIDTGVTPAGWDVFLSSFFTNGGTVTFDMRSAATAGGLTGATFYSVTSGNFPSSVPTLQYVQWRVNLTSTADNIPVVNSVTIQWFISDVDSIRPASIFVDSRYYIALAEVDQTTNNILLKYDLNGKWRRDSRPQIGTFSYFFNRPYCSLATSGQVQKFLEGTTDAGTSIDLDVRTKAIDFSINQFDNYSERIKLVGDVILEGRNTGASFQVYYSVDQGETFYALQLNSGSTTFTSETDQQKFYVRFRPNWDAGNPISGRTILYRILNTDANEVEIHGMKATALVRHQKPVITG